MTLRRVKPLTFRPKGCSDTLDATNAFPGAMSALTNLIPAPGTDMAWVCRPGSEELTAFPDTSSPGFVSGLLVVGNIAYGMIASALHAGKDEPFAYNLLTDTFLTVTGIAAANVPTSPPTSGAWTPPILCVVGQRIIVTHPGFPGGAYKFGWFDISGFTDNTVTGDTHTNTTLDNLSVNVLQSGWQVGMAITGSGFAAGTTIVSIAADGLSLVLSAATGSSLSATALTVTGGTTASPQWSAGDTNINNLASVPVGVAQMNGRAYFLVGNAIPFSDSLLPCQITNASQVLVPANGLACTAIGQVPLGAPLTGGIVQALVVFQSNYAMQQITGDPATNNLAMNTIKASTGTLAPLSITPITNGMAFVSPEGLRSVDAAAQVSPPIGDHGTGITTPFIFSNVPSRICAAANADVIRITTQDANITGQPFQEWWYDMTRKVWSGPHSFPASLIQPWGQTFVMTANGIDAKLWRSDSEPNVNSSYSENGALLQWVWQTSLLPDTGEMAENNLSESAIAMALPTGQVVTAYAQNEDGAILGSVVIIGPSGTGGIWGVGIWGTMVWGVPAGAFKQYRMDWPNPIVFKQMNVRLIGASAALAIGNLYMKYQILGYMLQST